jgi:hypothetical protein
MSKATSSYYPPRARWYSPVLYFLSATRRRLALDRIHLPQGISLFGLIASFLVPGLGFYFRNRVWGKLALNGCAALAAIFVVWLGYPIANLAFGLLLSIHVSGFTYYCGCWLNGEKLFTRILVALLLTFCLSVLIYFPLRNTFNDHYFAPLRVQNRVIIFRRQALTSSIKRGDTVAYDLQPISSSTEHVYAHGGLTLGKILAMPGDQVAFTSTNFTINGVVYARLDHMPVSGATPVPEKNWFIWPNLATIGGHGNVSEATISDIMLQMAIVPEEQFAGKPVNRWFGRRQVL